MSKNAITHTALRMLSLSELPALLIWILPACQRAAHFRGAAVIVPQCIEHLESRPVAGPSF